MLNQKMCPGFPWLSHDMRNHWSLSCFIPFIQFLYVKKKFSEPAQNSSKVVFQKCQVSASPACICSFPDRQITANAVCEGKLHPRVCQTFCLQPYLSVASRMAHVYLEKPNCHNLPHLRLITAPSKKGSVISALFPWRYHIFSRLNASRLQVTSKTGEEFPSIFGLPLCTSHIIQTVNIFLPCASWSSMCAESCETYC